VADCTLILWLSEKQDEICKQKRDFVSGIETGQLITLYCYFSEHETDVTMLSKHIDCRKNTLH